MGIMLIRLQRRANYVCETATNSSVKWKRTCVIIHLNVSVLKSKFLVHELFSTSEIRKPVVWLYPFSVSKTEAVTIMVTLCFSRLPGWTTSMPYLLQTKASISEIMYRINIGFEPKFVWLQSFCSKPPNSFVSDQLLQAVDTCLTQNEEIHFH